MKKKKVEIARFLIVLCVFITACSANNGNELVESVASPIAVNVNTKKSSPNNSSKQLANTNKSSDSITSGNVYISKIAPSEAICIAKLVIDTNNSYAIEVTTESCTAIFSALQDNYIDVTTTSGNWLHSFWTTSSSEPLYTNTIPIPDLQWDNESPDGIYYLYVGSNGDELIDVNISVEGSGLGAKIEFLR